ncbi:MAG: bifunctional DNA primase/polymerase, partial [Chloroflexota bacterium]
MDIIPHNPLNVQVSIPEFTDEIGAIWDTNQILTLGLTDTQRTAYALYDMGLNVMPQPHNRKGGLPWKRLQYGRLHRDDRSYGLRNLFAGDCNLAVMCGASSGNLFVIDCESEDSFIYHLNAMRRRSIPLWAVRTARGGHIYLRATNGEVANVEPSIMRDAEIKGRGGYVLAPPSVHPDGTPYRWLVQEGDCIPSVHTDKIDWLCDARGEHIRLVVEAPPSSERGNWKMHVVSPASNLSNATRDYMRNGGSIPEGSRNKRLFSAACDLCGNNYTQTEAQHILLPIAAMSGLPIAEIQHTIGSAFSQPRTPARPNKTTMHYEWRYALLWMTQHQWDSRTASSDRALMIALIERARVSSNEENVFRASIRELSELARLGTGTIRRGLERFQEVGTLKLYGHDKTSGASLWRFGIKIINVAKGIELNMDTVCLPPHWLKYSESIFNS